LQPTYPRRWSERPGLKNLKFMSPEFLDMLKFTAAKPRIGLRMDLTLGSGWPYAGPMFSDQGRHWRAPDGSRAGSGRTEVIAGSDGTRELGGHGRLCRKGNSDSVDEVVEEVVVRLRRK